MQSYTKLANSILTSTLWMEDDHTRLVWLALLAMADKNGEVQASIPGLANIARVPVDSCRVAIQKFLSPDPDSRSKIDEGRRVQEIPGGWHLINHGEYRRLASAEERREQDAIRQQRAREKAKRNATRHAPVTHPSRQILHTDTDTDADSTKTTRKPSASRAALSGQVQEVFEAWNATEGLPRVLVLSPGRKVKLEARLLDPFFAENWRAALGKVAASPFCRGCSERGWKATLDWFCRPDTVAKAMEGQYDNATPTHAKTCLGGAPTRNTKFLADAAYQYENVGRVD